MAEPRPRCSSVSLALEEPEFGTASTVTRWLLLEQPGPWGPDALEQSRLPRRFASELRARTSALGIRPIVIRRPGRSSLATRTCFLASTEERPRLERAEIGHLDDVLDLDLASFADGGSAGLTNDEDALFLVCTNGRRDPCCAERGRPLVRALEPLFGERVWECSHIGGDRFAANLVCFPHGVYFGRVAPDESVRVALGYREGSLDLDRYRGRSCYPMPVQAAEHFARRERAVHGVDALSLAGAARVSRNEIDASFLTSTGHDLTVRVRVVHRPARHLTCHAEHESAPRGYELVEIR